MDSSGFAVLVAAQKEAAARGGCVYLIGVRERVQRAIDILHAGDPFYICLTKPVDHVVVQGLLAGSRG